MGAGFGGWKWLKWGVGAGGEVLALVCACWEGD